MGRPANPHRSITCSFSLPHELRPQFEYIQMSMGLSAWIQEQLSQVKIDELFATQYGSIKDIIDKYGLYVRSMSMNGQMRHGNVRYDLVISGLGKDGKISIAVDIAIKKDFVGKERGEYGLVFETVNEIRSKGFDVQMS